MGSSQHREPDRNGRGDRRLVAAVAVNGLLTLAQIAGGVLSGSLAAIRILVLGSPPDIGTEDVVSKMRAIDGVRDIHHVHFWQMQEHSNAVNAHVVIEEAASEESDRIKERIKALLKEVFGIRHAATLEIERSAAVDHETRTYGHFPDEHRSQGNRFQ